MSLFCAEKIISKYVVCLGSQRVQAHGVARSLFGLPQLTAFEQQDREFFGRPQSHRIDVYDLTEGFDGFLDFVAPDLNEITQLDGAGIARFFGQSLIGTLQGDVEIVLP